VPDGERSLTALKHLLETFGTSRGVGASGIDFFAVDGVADAADRRDVTLLRAVKAALTKLSGPDFQAAFGGSTDQGDYRWGRLHRVTLDHPLGGPFNIPPAFGAFPAPLADLPGIPHRRRLRDRRVQPPRWHQRRPGTPFSVNLLPEWLTNDTFTWEQATP
jgi:penicillin G amidase